MAKTDNHQNPTNDGIHFCYKQTKYIQLTLVVLNI